MIHGMKKFLKNHWSELFIYRGSAARRQVPPGAAALVPPPLASSFRYATASSVQVNGNMFSAERSVMLLMTLLPSNAVDYVAAGCSPRLSVCLSVCMCRCMSSPWCLVKSGSRCQRGKQRISIRRVSTPC